MQYDTPSSGRAYTARFYSESQFNRASTSGFPFNATGTPIRTVQVAYDEQLVADPLHENATTPVRRLRVTEQTGSADPKLEEYLRFPDRLEHATGINSSGIAQRRLWSTTTYNSSNTERTTTECVSGNVRTSLISKTIKIEELGPKGWRQKTEHVLADVTADPSNSADKQRVLTTSWTYYNTPSDPNSHGKLKQVTNPDGSWERTEYGTYGRVVKSVHNFKNGVYDETNSTTRAASEAANVTTTHEWLNLATSPVSFTPAKTWWGTPIATGGSTMVADEISCSVVSYPYDSSSVPMERTYDIRWKSDGSDREVRWVIRCAEASAPGTLSTFIANIVNGLVAGTPTKLPYATDNLVEISERAKGENDVWQDTRSLSSDGKLRISTDAIVSGDRVETELSGYPDENPSGTDFLNVLVGGTRTVTVTNTFGMKSVETYDIQATSTTSDDLLLSYTEEQYPDSLGRPTKTMYLDNSVEQVEYGCCGVTKRIGRDGSETRYTLDPGSGRTLSETRDLPQGGSVTLAYEYDSEGRVTKVTREPYPAGDNAIVEKTTYDAAGRVIESVANGITTTNDYHREFYSSGSSRVMWSSVTSTQAGTGTSSLTPTQTQAVYPDGRKLRATGNTGLRTECDYAVELVASGSPNIYRLVTTETVLDASGTATSQWTKTDQDYLGRTDRIRYPGSGTVASKSFYGPKGLLVKQEDPDGVRTLYRSGWDTSTHSEFEISAIDMDSDLTNRTDDRNGLIDLNGVDRVTRIDRKAVADLDVTQDFPYGTRATTRQLDTASSDSSWTTIATADTFAGDARSVSYLGSSSSLLKSVTTTALNTTNHTRTVTTTSPDGISRETVYKFGMLVSDRSLSGSTEITKRVTAYDVHGRVASVTDNDPQSGTNNLTTTYTYLTIPSSPATVRDLVATVTTPLAAGTGTSQTTTYEYDPFGRVSVATLPDSVSGSHTVATTYDEAGRVKTVRGARTYPVDYSYDYRGNLEALSTYRTEGNSSTKATTKWIYDGARGWLTEKRYPASDTGIPPTSTTNGPTYTYTKAGRTATRTWARPVSTTYSYNEAGDLTSIEYDDATPGVYFGFDRRGRKTYVTDGAAERELTYDALDRVTKEEITDGTLQNLWQEQAFDDYGRRQSMAFHHATTPLATYNFAYNTNSQLDRVWRGQFMGVYDYEPHGTRVQSHTLRNLGSAPSSTPATNAGSEIAHAARTYDGLGRLTALDWQSASGISTTTLPETYAYTLNKANQRTAMTMTAGGSGDRPSYRWDFSYDTYGQLTGASKVWVSVPEQATGQQFGYTFDAIGNRTSAGKSEPSAGSPYASWAYTTDFTNKYTERSVPRKVDLMGYSSASSVHIAYANSPGSPGYENASSRQPSTSSVGPYFRHVLDYTGNSGAIDDAATVNTSTSVPVFAPATPEEYTYDEDGNLTGDGRCLYTWDAENRLIQVDLQPALAGFASVGFQGSWVYDYDYLGRRVRKYRITIDENSFSGGEEMRAGTPANTKPRPRRAAARSGDEMGIISDVSLFMYDGWLLTEELTSSKAVDRSYVWGLDISGSLQGAGGIGGLLFQINGSTPTTTNTRWASHDPQGNVTALRSVTNNSRWAWTEYGPFGETLMSAGTTEEFKLQYSSKYFDSESGLSYFGYRYYNAGTGKWMSRDPLEERSCANLFAFTGNHPQNSFDALGLEEDPALVQVMTQDELKAATAGTGVGSIQFINGKTGVMIAGENMVITGTPQKGMWKPKTGSTSVLFIYKTDNPKKLYRLDYDKIKMGPNAGQLGWEHNQEGVAKILKLTVQNHQPAGRWASNAGRAIKLVKYGGRALFVLGAAQSAVEIYYSENRTRTIIIEAAGWAGAAAGAWGGAKIGAVGGTFFSPGAGTAIGAVSGAIGGGIAGFWLGQTATQKVVDYYFFKTEQEEWKIAEICGGEEGMK
ncbi:MAG: RHS repeat domain-containing protein [Phycisphaerales bacterium]